MHFYFFTKQHLPGVIPNQVTEVILAQCYSWVVSIACMCHRNSVLYFFAKVTPNISLDQKLGPSPRFPLETVSWVPIKMESAFPLNASNAPGQNAWSSYLRALKLNGHRQIGEEKTRTCSTSKSMISSRICFPWYLLVETQRRPETQYFAPRVDRKSSKRSPLLLFQGTRKRTTWVRGSGGYCLLFPFSPTPVLRQCQVMTDNSRDWAGTPFS